MILTDAGRSKQDREMKSLVIMFLGLGICIWGAVSMWDHSDTSEGFAAAKPFFLVGGPILFVGMIVNHWEHTRRGE